MPIPRLCSKCLQWSIRSLGWRSKQAHDAHHDWIRIHRGRCKSCHLTFTFLPVQSPPYSHYSVAARSQTVERRFLEHRVWEQSAPELKSARCPDIRTLQRWCCRLDSRPGFQRLRRALEIVPHRVGLSVPLWQGTCRLCWTTVAVWLERYYWPLRL